MANDTRRWLDTDLPDELQAVLSSACEDHPRPAQVANLRASLEHAIGPAAFSMGAPTSRASAQTRASASNAETFTTKLFGASHSGLGSAAWGVGSLFALGLVAITARVVWSPHEAGRSSSAPVKIASAIDLRSQPLAAETPPPPAQEVVPAALVPKSGNAAPRSGVPRDAASSARSRPRSRPTLRAREPATQDAEPPAQVTLAEELQSLARIRSEMQSPARALVAVERHAKRFPAGALVPERELLQLEILLKAGQTVRAQRLAARLIGGAGDHPYRAQALQLLAEHDVAAGQ